MSDKGRKKPFVFKCSSTQTPLIMLKSSFKKELLTMGAYMISAKTLITNHCPHQGSLLKKAGNLSGTG